MKLPDPSHGHTAAQAAAALGIKASLIHTWENRGLLPHVGQIRGPGRGGTQWLYRLDDIRPLVDAHRQRTAKKGQESS